MKHFTNSKRDQLQKGLNFGHCERAVRMHLAMNRTDEPTWKPTMSLAISNHIAMVFGGFQQFMYLRLGALETYGPTVDGNQKSGGHAPVEVGSLSHCLPGFFYHHPRWLFGISSINSMMDTSIHIANIVGVKGAGKNNGLSTD